VKGTKKQKEQFLIDALKGIGANVSKETNRKRWRNTLKVWGRNIFLMNLAVRNTGTTNTKNSVDPYSYGFSVSLKNGVIFCTPY